MERFQIDAIERLLRQAGSAHGIYESMVLGGVYDENWPAWYARWVIDHGINDLVAWPYDAGELSRLLSDLNESHRRAGSVQPWTAFYAERLAARPSYASGAPLTQPDGVGS